MHLINNNNNDKVYTPLSEKCSQSSVLRMDSIDLIDTNMKIYLNIFNIMYHNYLAKFFMQRIFY